MQWKKLVGKESHVVPDLSANWEAEGIDFYEDVPYGTGNGHPLYLDLMVPQGTPEGKRPMLVWIHGGGWSIAGLDKKYRPVGTLVDACHAGFVCASIDYRLVTETPFPAPVEDCKCAIRFLKAHADEIGIDPERIGVWGESAGGQLAAIVGASPNNPRIEGNGGWSEYSSAVRAVCDWYCGGDMTHMGANACHEVQERARELGITLSDMHTPRSQVEAGKMFFGRPGNECPQVAMDISPIFYVDQPQPPYLLMHGDSDMTVPNAFSYNFYDALLSHGHDATFVLVPRQGHGYFKGQGYYDIVLNFFKKHLS